MERLNQYSLPGVNGKIRRFSEKVRILPDSCSLPGEYVSITSAIEAIKVELTESERRRDKRRGRNRNFVYISTVSTNIYSDGKSESFPAGSKFTPAHSR